MAAQLVHNFMYICGIACMAQCQEYDERLNDFLSYSINKRCKILLSYMLKLSLLNMHFVNKTKLKIF